MINLCIYVIRLCIYTCSYIKLVIKIFIYTVSQTLKYIKLISMAIPAPDPKYVFRGDMDCVNCILFQMAPNVENLYAGTAEGNVHIWDLNVNKIL